KGEPYATADVLRLLPTVSRCHYILLPREVGSSGESQLGSISEILPMAAVAPSKLASLPPSLTSASEPPALFDGTTRHPNSTLSFDSLYVAYVCPFAQRPWIARNYKGLQEKIELVPVDLLNRPAWYKEKLYAENKVPSLEHNNEVRGESLDLIKYIDDNFEGPALKPDDPAKQQFAEELWSYSDSFNMVLFRATTAKGDVSGELDAAYDKIEDALSKFSDGPFFLGQFSLVDIAYAPFVERFQTLLLDVKNYDILKGRPKLALWIEELNKIEPYAQTRIDPQELLSTTKKRFGLA
ncbi:Protein IN2-1, partial [Musa troglodytarum]